MKLIPTHFFVFVLLLCSGSIAAQSYIVKGQVIDKNTGQPLIAASVAAQNTTIGTLTDSSGFFKIKLPEGGYTLAISYTGYTSENVRVNKQAADEDLMIALGSQEKSLEEIAVVLDLEVKDGWERYGQFFIENFIGQTYFSKACIIRNSSALHFYFYKKRNVLKVIAKEPIAVDNFALGYVLKFSIDSFTYDYNSRTSLFVGYPLFEEMQGTPEQKNLWAKNRNSIYYGSLLHFMRSLYNKKLQQNGYELKFIFKTPTEEIPVTVKDPYGALRFEADSEMVIHIAPVQNEVAAIYHRERPEVAYLVLDPATNKNFQISTFIFNPEQPVSIERNGYYFPQEEVIINGYLGFKKIGDMLPYDYEPLPSN